MDNFDTTDQNSINPSDDSDTPEETELNHTDKLVGVISEPGETFEKTSKFPPRTVDWLLPLVLIIVFSIASQFILFNNAEIKYQFTQKQSEALQKAVTEGKVTQEQADKQIQFMSSPMMRIVSSVSTVIFVPIVFFIISFILFLFGKFALKGDGTYSSVLVANGLSQYIMLIHIILATVAGMIMGKLLQDVSVTSLLGMDKSSLVGWLLSFIDVITIWFLAVLSIGLAKIFKAQSTAKYFIMVFGLWFVWKLMVFSLQGALPFLRNF
jgi:hypothetical protein